MQYRNLMALRRGSAIKLQATYRSHAQREENRKRQEVEEPAAIKLQAATRGRMVRKSAAEDDMAPPSQSYEESSAPAAPVPAATTINPIAFPLNGNQALSLSVQDSRQAAPRMLSTPVPKASIHVALAAQADGGPVSLSLDIQTTPTASTTRAVGIKQTGTEMHGTFALPGPSVCLKLAAHSNSEPVLLSLNIPTTALPRPPATSSSAAPSGALGACAGITTHDGAPLSLTISIAVEDGVVPLQLQLPTLI